MWSILSALRLIFAVCVPYQPWHNNARFIPRNARNGGGARPQQLEYG